MASSIIATGGASLNRNWRHPPKWKKVLAQRHEGHGEANEDEPMLPAAATKTWPVFEVAYTLRAAPSPSPLGGSKTSMRVFGEGLAAIRKTLPGLSLRTADPLRGEGEVSSATSKLAIRVDMGRTIHFDRALRHLSHVPKYQIEDITIDQRRLLTPLSRRCH